MELLTDDLRSRLPLLRSQDNEPEPMIHARFFLPGTELVWYAIEGRTENEDYLFYGFVLGPNAFQYFRLSELEAARGTQGQTVQRDQAFIPGRLTEVVPAPDL